MDNRLRRRLREGHLTTNAWLTIPHPWAVELVSKTGYDAVTLDLQHGLFDLHSVASALQVIDPAEVTPAVRLAWNDPAAIMRVLDLGAQVLICPLINSAAEAAAFVQACHYPPFGYRSYGPIRANLQFGADYPARTRELVMSFAMIETAAGLADLEAIAAVAGLDGLFVGPADLSLGLGLSLPVDFSNPTLREALQRVVATAQAHGLVAGAYGGNASGAQQLRELGFQFVTAFNDSDGLANAARAVRQAL